MGSSDLTTRTLLELVVEDLTPPQRKLSSIRSRSSWWRRALMSGENLGLVKTQDCWDADLSGGTMRAPASSCVLQR